MKNHLRIKFIITIVVVSAVFCLANSLFAQEVADLADGDKLSQLQEQARKYREAGFKNQDVGNLPLAMSLYQKAIALDPNYAVAYNDLGVVYEATGALSRAEESYLKALNIDPEYLSACTNLAIFYENKRDLQKAAFYWNKRAELGLVDDPWTQKAVSRLKDIRAVLSSRPNTDQREQDVLNMMKDIAVQKAVVSKDDQAKARDHFRKAKISYNKDDLATAIKEALDAQYLDQDNPEIEAFIDKTTSRALTR